MKLLTCLSLTACTCRIQIKISARTQINFCDGSVRSARSMQQSAGKGWGGGGVVDIVNQLY